MRGRFLSNLLISQKYFRFIGRKYSVNATCHSDVCVVGGGMVGLYAALGFASSPSFKNHRVLLIEGAPYKEMSVGNEYSNRVVALSPRTREILDEVGVWNIIESVRKRPVRRMQVWEDQSEAYITLEKDEMNSEMAYIVENSLVIYALTEALKKSTNVEVIYDRKLNSIEQNDGQATLCLSDGSNVCTNLVIGCDGYNSHVRKIANIHTTRWDHDQKGIVATLELEEEEEGNDNSVAWQRFLKTGPVALLPLDARTSSLVWSTTFAEAKRLLALPDDEFVQELNGVLVASAEAPAGIFGSVLSQLTDLLSGIAGNYGSPRQLPPKIVGVKSGSKASFPLGFMHANNYVAPGTALLGDAAHRILPLAGQGVNLGFGDAHCLIRKMEQCLYDGEMLGHLSYLRDYETERQQYVVPVMGTIEALYRLYATDFPPAVIARSLGLQAINSMPSVKKIIVNGATSGRLSLEL